MLLSRGVVVFFLLVEQAFSLATSSRRKWMETVVRVAAGGGVAAVLPSRPVGAQVEELPSILRPLTNLAPRLPQPSSPQDKTLGLSLPELALRLNHDLLYGSKGTGGYFLTGDVSTDIFRNDCVFVDPTNEVANLSQYQSALKSFLFDPGSSQVELVQPVLPAGNQLKGTLRSRGFLRFPWHPYVTAYETDIVYTVDQDGLIARQEQKWTKSAEKALQETLTPTIFTPPPKSKFTQPEKEPATVTALFNKVNGRRPNEYSQEERFEIARLIEEIVGEESDWRPEWLIGTWMLVYLQEGPGGGGIDRRVPFPEFGFNDNYQVFGNDSVVNIGEVFGPLVRVRVSGTLQPQDETILKTPKRYIANIGEGKLCWKDAPCVQLPISGKGLFDGVYLGERLRIGQNINGGGARVVQVRIS